jgi:hypothetical protein
MLIFQSAGTLRNGGLLTMALTDLEIKRAKTKDKLYKLSDGSNMYLRVTPAGGKLWRWAFDTKARRSS